MTVAVTDTSGMIQEAVTTMTGLAIIMTEGKVAYWT